MSNILLFSSIYSGPFLIVKEPILFIILILRYIFVNPYNHNISTFSANAVLHKKRLFRVTVNLFILPVILNFRHQNPQFTMAKIQIQYIYLFFLQQNKQISPFQIIVHGKISWNENSAKNVIVLAWQRNKVTS